MAEGDITEGQGAANGGNINRAPRPRAPEARPSAISPAAQEALEVSARELVGLPATQREQDPRWQEVYQTKPDAGPAPKRDPNDPETDRLYLEWRGNNRDNEAEYRRKADEALKTADPDAFEHYQRYSIYSPAARDPEARHLFLDNKGNTVRPTDSEIEEFKQKYPEKAAIYGEAIENAKNRTPRGAQQRMGSLTNTEPQTYSFSPDDETTPPAQAGGGSSEPPRVPPGTAAAREEPGDDENLPPDEAVERFINNLRNQGLLHDDQESSEPPKTPESDPNPTPENIHDRQLVLDTFDQAFAAWEAYPEDRMTPDQVAARDLLREIKAKTTDIGKDTYTINFKAGPPGAERRVRQTEGPPVGSLMAFLTAQISSGELSPDELEEYAKWNRVLLANVKPYFKNKSRKEDEEKLLGRVNAEAQRVAGDERLATGDQLQDVRAGRTVLNGRWELSIPPVRKEKNPDTPLPPKPTITGDRDDTPWTDDEINDALIRDRDREDEFKDKVLDRFEEWKKHVHDPVKYDLQKLDNIEDVLHGWWVVSPDYIRDAGDLSNWPDEEIDDVLNHLWLPPNGEDNGPANPNGPTIIDGGGIDNGPQQPSGGKLENPNGNGGTTDNGGRTTEGNNTNEALPPVPPTPVEEVREIWFANRSSDIMKRAGELAETQLQHEQRRGNILNPLNWFRKSRMRIFEEYYRQVYTERAREAMRANHNSYLDLDVTKKGALAEAEHKIDQEREAGKAKIEQLKTGEFMKGQTVREATGELKTAILNEFVKKIVSGDIKDFATVQEKLREFIEKRQDDPQIKELFGKDANQYQRVADYFATDLLEMGALIKQDIDANRYALDQMDAYVSIKLANTEWGSEGQSKFNATDKLANFLRNGLGGPFKNPALAGAITSLGFYGAFRAVGYGGKAANFIVPGSGILTGAVLGAVRRNYDLKVDRASHQVARAYNYEIAPKSHNREQLEKFAYDTISVKQLVDGEGEGTARGLKKLLGENLTTNEAQAAVMNKIAEIRARLDISAEKDADLITFSGRTTVEQERLALIKSIVEAKIALKNAGLTDEQITAKTSDLGSEWRTKLEQNMQEKDKEFNRYRLSQSIKAGTIGAVAGLASGLLVKEIGGAALGFHDSSAVGKDLHNTLPHVGIVNKEVSHVSGTIGGDIHKAGDALGISKDFNSAKKFVEDNLGIHHRASEHAQGFNGGTGTIHETIRGNDISIPQGTELVNNGGHYDLIVAGHPDHTLVTNVVGPDGHVNLNAAGAAGEIHRQVASQDVLGPDGEWAKNSTNITRQWYGNNTPFSDRNELRVDNSVFSTANGQKGVDFDMSRMTGLSFQNGNSPEAIDVRQALAQGRMGISFTTDDNPQNAIFVALDPNGHLRLDPTDFAHHINADPNSMTRGEFSQIVLNQNALNNLKDGPLESELLNHRDVFNLSHGGRPGAIEVGVLTDGGPSGHRLNVLATGLGTGRTPATIETPHYAIDINKIPGAGDGLKHHGNEIPIIPIPYTPRHTLERMNGGNEEKIEPVASQTRGETLGPAETLEQGGIITGLTEQEKIPSYSISDTEDEKRKQILENVEIHGDEFDGKTLTTELLEQEGLGPKHEIKIEGGPTFYISDPYMASGGRAAVVGYVEKDGKLLARTYYRSGSQGVFRYLPGYRTDDMGNIDWFSKGFGEESITLPIYIQEGLANIVNSNPPKTVSDPNLIFAGTARNINKQMTSGNTYIQEVESKPVQLEGIFFPSDRNAKLAPETLTFANEGDAPNFAEPLATWNQSNNIYGNYVSQVFISKNKRYKYIFNKDASGKVWIGAVENNSPIQSTGLRQSWVTGGDLLTPAYEYAKQAGEFGNDGDKKGHYVDAFTNYLSKVQVIKDYIESQAQPKPAPTTLAESETEEPEKRLTVTPIEASDNTMAAVRMGLSKKLETSADNETVLSFTPEQLNLLFLSINRPSGITAQDFIATAKEGSFTDIDDETKRAITEGSLPDGWTISKVSLLNGNVLLDFKKEAKQRLELTHDMTEDEAREKLEAFYESLDEEGKEKLDALLERTDDLIGNLSAIEYAETVEASFAAVKGKGKEDLLNKNTSGDNPKITAYINSLAHLYKPEDSEKARNVLQNMFDSSQKLRGLIERETDTRKLSPIFVTALSIGWDQLGMEPPQRLPMAEQTANAGQTQAQANETLRRLQGEGTRVPQTGTLEASTGLQDEQEAILVESVNNTPEAVRLGVDKKLETTIDNKTALRFTTDQFISYLKNNPLKPEEILDGNFESTLAIVESLIKTGGVPSELPPASRDVLVKIINPMLPTGWNIDNVKLGDNKAEIRFTKEGVETTGLEASTPVPERNEENEARLNEMISSLPEVEQREIMGQPINEYLSDFADTLAELRKPPHNLSRSDADKLLGAATIVQRETASLPDVMAYYKIVEDNKDNPALKAGLETGAAIVFDANTTIPRLEQSQDGPKIHMLRSTARFIVGRESAINADKAIKEMLETGKTETQAEELAAYIESMLGIIQGRRNVNQ